MPNIHRYAAAFPPRSSALLIGSMLRAILAAGLSTLIAIGCGGPQAEIPSNPTGHTTSAPERGLQKLLVSTDIDGQVVGPAQAGQNATLVVLFASWCSPCRRELAILSELRQERSQLRIVGLNAFEEWGQRSDEHKLRAFLAEHAPWLQVVHGDSELMAAMGQPRKIPSIYVYDRQGTLIRAYLRSQRHPPSKAELTQTVDQALARTGPKTAHTIPERP